MPGHRREAGGERAPNRPSVPGRPRSARPGGGTRGPSAMAPAAAAARALGGELGAGQCSPETTQAVGKARSTAGWGRHRRRPAGGGRKAVRSNRPPGLRGARGAGWALRRGGAARRGAGAPKEARVPLTPRAHGDGGDTQGCRLQRSVDGGGTGPSASLTGGRDCSKSAPQPWLPLKSNAVHSGTN